MNDEIKEILDRFKMTKEIKLMLDIIKDVSEHKEGSRNGLMILSCKDYKTLLDYITNLQQENERLKEANEILEQNWLDYMKCCEKAIEYITSYEAIETIQQCDHSKNNEDLDYSTIDEMTRRYLIVHDNLLNILQGEDNDNNRQ